MNINVSGINFTGIIKNRFSGQGHQKPIIIGAKKDVFVKSTEAKKAESAMPEDNTVKKYRTTKEEHPVTDKEHEELDMIRPRLAANTKRLLEAKQECGQRMQEADALCGQKIDEAKKLYESKAKSTPEGGKVAIQGDEMVEYGKNGEVIRKTTFKDDVGFVSKRSVFGGYKLVKAKVKTPTVIEFNTDGTRNIFTEDSYTLGYKKHSDGSEEYRAKLSEKHPDRNARYYSEEYRKDADGKETFEVSLYKDLHGADVYLEGEQVSKDGSVSIKSIYMRDLAPMRVGFPPETVYMDYAKDTEGRENYAEKSVCTYDKKLHLYVKDFAKTPDGREEWSKFFERKHDFRNNPNNGKWFSYTPKQECC